MIVVFVPQFKASLKQGEGSRKKVDRLPTKSPSKNGLLKNKAKLLMSPLMSTAALKPDQTSQMNESNQPTIEGSDTEVRAQSSHSSRRSSLLESMLVQSAGDLGSESSVNANKQAEALEIAVRNSVARRLGAPRASIEDGSISSWPVLDPSDIPLVDR